LAKKENNIELACIFCGLNSNDGEKHAITDEHIIPKVLGGWLTLPFVCKDCNNNRIGSRIESILKKNSFIVSALNKLNIQPKKLAFREAKIELDFNLSGKLKAKYDKSDKPEYYPQQIDDGSIIAPENEAKGLLKKQIERWEKNTGKKVEFDISEFDNFPYDIAIPIYGTDISFIKRRNQKATVTISRLDAPIPFEIPAIIAFEHLAGLDYNFIRKKEFDHIANWILNNGKNCHVLLNTMLRNISPDDLEYLPYHYIKYGFQSEGISAIVVLFGVIKFLVFLGEIENINDFAHQDILDYYHVYDLNTKELLPTNAPSHVSEHDNMLLESVTQWGKWEMHNDD